MLEPRNTHKSQLHSLDIFDAEVSLWQILPTTTGLYLKLLKYIVDYELNHAVERGDKPLSLLIIGSKGTGKRTISRAFLRSIAVESIKEISGSLVQVNSSLVEYFYPSGLETGYLITEFEQIDPSVMPLIYQIITSGEYRIYNYSRRTYELYPVYGPMILTTENLEKVPSSIIDHVSYQIKLTGWTQNELILVILQRIRYCQLDYEGEQVLNLLLQTGKGDLRTIIQLLKLTITIVLAQNRSKILIQDVRKAAQYM